MMSFAKKDPSLRVAATDPHLVSLGGGRLSTAVTIHYIHIGDTTIGSATTCNISLNGSGVHPQHCTIYRSEENEVTIVPELGARILIDGTQILNETNLIQGAMITIGISNYLRFNNPDEAMMMRSAIGNNKRISMPQIDFIQAETSSSTTTPEQGNTHLSERSVLRKSFDIQTFYEPIIHPTINKSIITNNSVTTIAPISMAVVASNETMMKTSMIGGNKTKKHKIMAPFNINGMHCPKVFTADLVTVNMPAKVVLGQKYARNLAENHRREKQVNNKQQPQQQQAHNNQVLMASSSNDCVQKRIRNISNNNSCSYIKNSNTNNSISKISTTNKLNSGSTEYLTKINNMTTSSFQHQNTKTTMRTNNIINNQQQNSYLNHSHSNAYDRYPKLGTYGGSLQIYPMNGVNTEINNASIQEQETQQRTTIYNNHIDSNVEHSNHSLHVENECVLEDMLKICTEYADRQSTSNSQHQSNNCTNNITSSPVVQNRIKTNGSLPRDKNSPFYHQKSHNKCSDAALTNTVAMTKSTGYENIRLVGTNRVEKVDRIVGGIKNQQTTNIEKTITKSPGYETVVYKYVPQSPRTKIRTTCCMSPKRGDSSFSNTFGTSSLISPVTFSPHLEPVPTNRPEYEQLIKTFEEKLKIEMQSIEESGRDQLNNDSTHKTAIDESSRINKNIYHLGLNLHGLIPNSPKHSKITTPAPPTPTITYSNLIKSQKILSPKPKKKDSDDNIIEIISLLKTERRELLNKIQRIKSDMSKLENQYDEVVTELDMKKALTSVEFPSVAITIGDLSSDLQALQSKIHRLEAQRNATRVRDENQQTKLKQSIEMKQDQVKKLKAILKQQKPNNDCLKEELNNVTESLDNDRKIFEDLEFQYFEEESEWHAYREELKLEEKSLQFKIEEQRTDLTQLENDDNQTNQTTNHGHYIDVHRETLKHNLLALINELTACQQCLIINEKQIWSLTEKFNTTIYCQSIASDDDDDVPTMIESKSNMINGGYGGIMSQSLFGSAELLHPKRSNDDSDIMSKSVNENMFYNNKIEAPRAATCTTPKHCIVDINDDEQMQHNLENNAIADLTERVQFNLSLGSYDFEVNTLDQQVPCLQNDIERICKVTSDAPISTKGTNNKNFDSIEEIELNRELLLDQQGKVLELTGQHVSEHGYQKMHDFRKTSHDEALSQYLIMLNEVNVTNCDRICVNYNIPQQQPQLEEVETKNDNYFIEQQLPTSNTRIAPYNENQKLQKNIVVPTECTSKKKIEAFFPALENEQRHSELGLDSQTTHQHQHQQHLQNSSRPLSDTNTKLSCSNVVLKEKTESTHKWQLLSDRTIGTEVNNKLLSTETNPRTQDKDASARLSTGTTISLYSGRITPVGAGQERKRMLLKHQRPLTRYLPIYSPDLNLRHHIESAGHQITLCPHVLVDALSCRGYLHKLGATFHGWARRWFVLDRQRNALIYYSDKSERKPRGGAYFPTIDEVYLDHLNASKSGRPHCTFIVKTKKRSYQLQAASDASARIWIDAIITGAQGNLDY